jgi:hypothetical protein
VLHARRIGKLAAEVCSHFLGYAHETGSPSKGKVSMPTLTEATVADGAITLGLRPTPKYALAYPAICPLILLDEVLADFGCFGVCIRRRLVTHNRSFPNSA